MAGIILKKVRTTQPQQVVGINYANPITRGLVFSRTPAMPYVSASSTVERRVNKYGIGDGSSGNTGLMVLKSSVPSSVTLDDITLSIVGSFDLANTVIGTAFGLGYNGTQGLCFIGGDASAGLVFRTRDSIGTNYTCGYSGFPSQIPYVITATRSAKTGTQCLYVNGNLVSSVAVGTAANTPFFNITQGGMSRPGDSLPKACNINQSLVFNRALTPSEIKSLSDNPWQIFAPETRVITFDSVVTGSGGIDLIGAGSTQSNTSTNGSITQVHSLLANNSSQTNQTTSGSLAQDVTLVGQGSVQGNTSSTAAFTQVHSLVSQSSAQANSTTSGTLTQVHSLVSQSSTQSNLTTSGTLTQNHVIVAQAVSQANSTSSNGFTQVHSLTAQSSVQSNSATNGIIPAPGVINPIADNSAQSNSTTSGTLTQVHSLVSQPSTQANTTSNGTLTQVHKLTAQSVTQSNSVTNGTLAQIHNLIANSAIQVNSSTTGSLSGAYNLSAQNCVQTNQTTSGNLSASISLVSANTTQSNTSESVIISQTHNLIGRSVVQTRTTTTVNSLSGQKPVAWFAPGSNTPSTTPVVIPPPVLPAKLLNNPRVQSMAIENRKMKIEVVSTRFKI